MTQDLTAQQPPTHQQPAYIGYVRATTEPGIDAQHAAIVAHAESQGWALLTVYVERGGIGRPRLRAALAYLKRAGAEGLIVTDLTRLTRTAKGEHFYREQARTEDWQLVTLTEPAPDPLDTIAELTSIRGRAIHDGTWTSPDEQDAYIDGIDKTIAALKAKTS